MGKLVHGRFFLDAPRDMRCDGDAALRHLLDDGPDGREIIWQY